MDRRGPEQGNQAQRARTPLSALPAGALNRTSNVSPAPATYGQAKDKGAHRYMHVGPRASPASSPSSRYHDIERGGLAASGRPPSRTPMPSSKAYAATPGESSRIPATAPAAGRPSPSYLPPRDSWDVKAFSMSLSSQRPHAYLRHSADHYLAEPASPTSSRSGGKIEPCLEVQANPLLMMADCGLHNTQAHREAIRELLELPDIEIPREGRAQTPHQMSCKLMEHQKVALKWLKEQENGAKRGGLLADTMGLGKTIEALALILAHKPPDTGPKTTLIIAPLALLKQWDREIASKVKPSYRLSTFIYHGRKKKTKEASRLYNFDIVLTTYETVASEFRKGNARLFGQGCEFYRIILDEAHKIKNRNAWCSKAVFELDAKYRLCMTGTPFMNNPTEIYPLLRFLRIKPYNDWLLFREYIDRPLRAWANDRAQAGAMQKVQVVFRSITLRRTKDSRLDDKPIISLPERKVSVARAVFNKDQKEFYDALENKQRIAVNRYLKQGELSKVYTFILVLLLRLRQTCCHPDLIKNHGIPDEARLNGKQMLKLAMRFTRRTVEQILSKTTFECPLCADTTGSPIIIYPCGHDICSECFSGMMTIAADAGEDSDNHSLMGFGLDAEELESMCPRRGCETVIDPKKIVCHSFFLDAHKPGGSQSEPEVSDVGHDDDCCSSEEFSGDESDDHESLRDFIVSDPDGYSDDDNAMAEDVKSEGKPRRRIRLTPATGPTLKDEDFKRSGSERDDPSGNASDGGLWSCRDHKPTPDAGLDSRQDSYVNDDEHWDGRTKIKGEGVAVKGEGDRGVGGPGNGNEDGLRPEMDGKSHQLGAESALTESEESTLEAANDGWAGVLARYRARKNAKAKEASDSDSDSLSLPSIQGFGMKSKVRPEGTLTVKNMPRRSTAKRKRQSSSVAPCVPAKRFKKEGVQAARSMLVEPEPCAKEGKRGNGKGKSKTLAQLKKAASTSKAARAKYFARLREDFISSAKIDVTVDLLRSIREDKPTDKILVFSLWSSFLDLLEIPIKEEGFRYLRYDGGMSFNERDDNVRKFSEDPNVQILLVSLMAGNAGLNLTAASQVIILEPFWNPYVEDQAVDRAHRIGQQKNVEVHRVLVAETVEDRILELQEKKRKLVNTALSEKGATYAARLSVGELRGLFGIR